MTAPAPSRWEAHLVIGKMSARQRVLLSLVPGVVHHPPPDQRAASRLGFWQTLILTRWQPLFAHLPVESLVHAQQSAYYGAIRASSAAGESTPFIAFMLQMSRRRNGERSPAARRATKSER